MLVPHITDDDCGLRSRDGAAHHLLAPDIPLLDILEEIGATEVEQQLSGIVYTACFRAAGFRAAGFRVAWFRSLVHVNLLHLGPPARLESRPD
jgi:hypothetical protein